MSATDFVGANIVRPVEEVGCDGVTLDRGHPLRQSCGLPPLPTSQGEARGFIVGNGVLDIPLIKCDEVTP